MLCSHHHYFKTVSSPPKENPYLLSSHFLISPLLWSLETSNLLSLFMNLFVLDISHSGIIQHVAFWFVALSTTLEIHPHSSMYKYLIRFYDWRISHWWMYHNLFIHSSVREHLGFPLWVLWIILLWALCLNTRFQFFWVY